MRVNPASFTAASQGAAAASTQLAGTASDSSRVYTFEHKPFLVGMHCDSPARQKVACWLGVAAYLACGWCLFRAQRLAGASGKEHSYPKGYSKSVPQPHLQAVAPTAAAAAPAPAAAAVAAGAAGAQRRTLKLRVGAEQLQLTDQQQMRRALLVQGKKGGQKKKAASQQGCNGLSAIPEIEYVSYSNIWVAPVIHMLLYGVVAEFLRHVLCVKGSKSKQAAARAEEQGDEAAAVSAGVGRMDDEGKKRVAQRAGDIRLTSDFGRTYKDITKYLNSYKMEDFLHFVETFSLYIFKDVSPFQWRMGCCQLLGQQPARVRSGCTDPGCVLVVRGLASSEPISQRHGVQPHSLTLQPHSAVFLSCRPCLQWLRSSGKPYVQLCCTIAGPQQTATPSLQRQTPQHTVTCSSMHACWSSTTSPTTC